MAGTLFGLPLSQQVDERGEPLSGGLLYVYAANTSTPAVTYSDFALATVQAWPLELSASGRVPSFYVDDGSYRARLTTSGGVEIFDEQSITSIGASAGSSGDSSSQDTTTIFQTGDPIWVPIAGARSGWVRANGRTLGNGSSGATERANSDTQALFEYLWNNFADGTCAVSTGRGASATADFNANKTIVLLDMRSKLAMGLDTMGNSAASVTGGSSTAADALGASTLALGHGHLSTVAITTAVGVGAGKPLFAMTVPSSGNVEYRSGSGTAVVKSVSFSEHDVSGASPLNQTVVDNDLSDATTSLQLVNPNIAGTITLNSTSQTKISLIPPVRTGTWYLKL